MFIFIINSLGFGGAESSLIRVLGVFKRNGIPFKLVVQNKVQRELDYSHISEETIFLQNTKSSFYSFFLNVVSYKRISGHLNLSNGSYNGNVKIIGLLPQSVILGYLLKKKNGCELIPVEENNLELSLKSGFQNILFKSLLKRIYKDISRCIVISREIGSQMQDFFDYRGEINFIPNCIDLVSQKIRSDVSSSKYRFVMLGRLVSQKNYFFALNVFKELNNLGLDFTVDVYGSGPGEKLISSKINEYGLGDIVKLKGITTDVMSTLDNYDYFIHTALYEGFGNVIIEAMYKKLVVICSDVDYGPREIISNNINGFLLPLSVHHWVEFINNLAVVPFDLNSIREAARRRASDFGSENVAIQYLKLLSDREF